MPTHYQGTPEEILALNTFIKLTRAADSLMARLAQRGTLCDLTPSQFGVLESLYHLGPMCQGEVSAKILRSTGNMTLVLDNLEKRGLVRRERGVEDRRMVFISLTEAGREAISRILPRQIAAIVEEMSILTPEEQATLGRVCRKLGKRGKE
jgi:MarR family 2-MHQ and catechol resistance regulon transcriptional repressor